MTTVRDVKFVLTPRKQDEISEFAKFASRIIRAYGRRVADGEVETLVDLLALSRELDQIIDRTVMGLHDFGYSWQEIADRLGVTKQAAHQRWRQNR